MANSQTSASHFKRTLWWFGRHKVTAVFAALLLVLFVWSFSSWVVLQTQIHFERERYVNTNNTLKDLNDQLHRIGVSSLNHYHRCSYTDNGSVFAIKYLECQAGTDIVVRGIARQDALIKLQEIKNLLINKVGRVTENHNPYQPGDLGIYDFKLNKINCIYDGMYYDQAVSQYVRPASFQGENDVETIEIDCGGNAKAEYFPITKD